jgi:hypothetical protein
LLAGSPALNAGDVQLAPFTDQRGVRRGGTVEANLGAYESTVSQYQVSGFPPVQTAGVPANCTVTALDQFGKVTLGESFSILLWATGQATLPSHPALTNGVGTFSATLFTAGQQALYATDEIHIFPENVLVVPAQPAHVTAIAGVAQGALVGTSFATPLEVLVTDPYGNPVSNTSVTFAAPTAGPSGAFAGPATVLTNSQGLALAPALVANGIPGSYTVTASVFDVSSKGSFSLTNLTVAPVAPASTITALNVATAGGSGSVLLTADVSGGSTTPTGYVLFFDVYRHHGRHVRLLGVVLLQNGIASLGVRLPPGQHQLLAGYLGDATHSGGSSFWVTFVVPSGHH